MSGGNWLLDPESKQLKILVVDDEPMLRSVIEDFLNLLGFEDHRMASDGLEALGILRSTPIDVMISDIRMPKMELNELLGIVRVEFPDLAVVATSGFSDFDSAVSIINCGAHDFLGKPLNLDALEATLGWIIRRRRVLARARSIMAEDAGRDEMPSGLFSARLEELTQAFGAQSHQFHALVEHSARIADLARRMNLDLDDKAHQELIMAALLHEIGASYQMYALCREPRRLEEKERLLVHAHSPIGGRMIAKALGKSDYETIVGQHLQWQHVRAGQDAPGSAAARSGVWLGLLNCVDGCLHDRPDRQAIKPEQLHASLLRRCEQYPIPALKKMLDQWSLIESFYVKR